MPDAAAPGSALAARCTACGTVFRVVPDQLRVSGGWVRCGRCAQVFNALENLIDLDTGGAPRRFELGNPDDAQPPAGAAYPVPAPSTSRSANLADQPALPWAAAVTTAAVTRNPTEAATFAGAPAPANLPAKGAGAASPDRPALDASRAGWPPADPGHDAAAVASRASAGAVGIKGLRARDRTEPTPSFLRQAERAARWRQPRVRAALAAGCGLAALLLAAQVLHAARDTVAAKVPALRPLLAQGCTWLGCTVQAPRRLEQITVESSGLLLAPAQRNIYELSVALRNRAPIALAVPAVELSLTDAQGRLLSRRVLQPADFGLTATASTGAAFQPGADLHLQARLQTAPSSTPDETTPAVVGYTIELFYP
jgi:predicted Zn finger-like uncharacterized protein